MMKKATLAYGLPTNTLLFELRELCLTNYSNNSSVSWPALGLDGCPHHWRQLFTFQSYDSLPGTFPWSHSANGL